MVSFVKPNQTLVHKTTISIICIWIGVMAIHCAKAEHISTGNVGYNVHDVLAT